MFRCSVYMNEISKRKIPQLTDEDLLSEKTDPVLQNELRKIDRRHKHEIKYDNYPLLKINR